MADIVARHQLNYERFVAHLSFEQLSIVENHLQASVRTFPVGTRLLCVAMVLGVTVLLASLSFRWLETPIANWGRRLQGR